MKKYTLQDFAQFERMGKFLLCPSGDYTGIQEFPAFCSFGGYCVFGYDCRFGEGCSFSECCRFGARCRFGAWCRFGEDCSLGEGCSFGEGCDLRGCVCEFGKVWKMLSHHGYEGGIYFFILTNGGIYARHSDFAGTLEEWENAVRGEHGDKILGQALLASALPVRILAKAVKEGNQCLDG